MNKQELNRKITQYKELEGRRIKFRREIQRARFFYRFNGILANIAAFSFISLGVSAIAAIGCKGLELMALGNHEYLQAQKLEDGCKEVVGLAVVDIATLMGAGFSAALACYVEEISQENND